MMALYTHPAELHKTVSFYRGRPNTLFLSFPLQIRTFGLSMMALDVRQESTRHTDVMDAITTYLGLGSYASWGEEERLAFLLRELQVGDACVSAVGWC